MCPALALRVFEPAIALSLLVLVIQYASDSKGESLTLVSFYK